jgi:hypothetical protein
MKQKRVHDPFLLLLEESETVVNWVIVHHGRRIAISVPEERFDEALSELEDYASHLRRPQKGWKPTYFKTRSRHKLTIYFISSDDLPDYPIKIGQTDGGIGERLATLQCGNPHRLRVLATDVGSNDTERWLHRDHHPARLNGEWFRRTPELMAEIKRLTKGRGSK